jgi:hypothetical protein
VDAIGIVLLRKHGEHPASRRKILSLILAPREMERDSEESLLERNAEERVEGGQRAYSLIDVHADRSAAIPDRHSRKRDSARTWRHGESAERCHATVAYARTARELVDSPPVGTVRLDGKHERSTHYGIAEYELHGAGNTEVFHRPAPHGHPSIHAPESSAYGSID